MLHRTLRLIVPWLLVMASTSGGLSLLDRVPSWLTGVPHGARRHESIEAGERAVGMRLWLPAFFPADLAWPPAAVLSMAGPPSTILLEVSSRAGVPDYLLVCQTSSPAPPPPRLLPAGQLFTATPLALGPRPATLEHRFLASGREVHDLTWEQGGRRITLRYAGPVEQLLLMGNSLERSSR